jgi:glycerol-3-phosphate O-acyltransferase
MFDRLKGFSFAIVRSVLAWMTKPKALGSETLPPHSRIVYVLNSRSLTDLVMLDIVTRANGLPRPGDPLTGEGFPEQRRFFFLNRPTGALLRRNQMRTYSKRLLRLQRYFRDTRKADISLVPVSVFWSRAPNRERSVVRVLLSEDWTVTSRFRRLVVILFNRRDITVEFGAPIALREIAEPDISDGRLVRRIARLVRAQFKKQRTALLGPDLSHRRTLIDQLVASRAVRSVIAAEVARGGGSEVRLTRRARRFARAIASDMSYVTMRLLEALLTRFWNRIYDGIDVRGIERVKPLAETATVIYVPSHRSHVDYLLLSYLLYNHSLMIPHIAAGDNLDMPIVGSILRRGGAFFMRRSFRDDRLYTAVLSEYLYQIVRRGSPSEYFIEGGRSRTGRLLPPRTGLLNMTIASHIRGIPRPIVFVPVYIGYEKLVEASSYLDELRGEAKSRESIRDVVRGIRLIKQVFGRVHVSFGAALPLDDFLARTTAQGAQIARELGVELLKRINAVATVNPINLIALVTLSTPKQTIDESLLIEQLDCLAGLLRANAPYSDIAVTNMTGKEMIAHAESLGMLVRESHPFGDVLGHDPVHAVLMTWYRNNTIHAFALPSLIACLLVNRRRRIQRDQLLQMLAAVYPYLQSELYIATPSNPAGSRASLENETAQWLDHLRAQGLVRIEDGEVGPPPLESDDSYRLALLSEIAMQMLERFFIVVGLLQQAGQHNIDRRTLERHCTTLARRISRLYGLNAPEFFDARLFHNFVDTLIARDVVHVAPDGRLSYEPVIAEVTRTSGVVLPMDFRLAVLRARPQRENNGGENNGAQTVSAEGAEPR